MERRTLKKPHHCAVQDATLHVRALKRRVQVLEFRSRAHARWIRSLGQAALRAARA